ncbi:MAG: hypothetical protein AMS27_05990 [Bacteroides sp. SM23_62_1]|nr:MAG: hypothetical protein AMS27_05990 [Bacteroides sp. SM23_62_1]
MACYRTTKADTWNSVWVWRIIFGFLLLCSGQIYAQFYSQGEDPASIRWSQINSTHFKIIYPAEFSEEAKRVTHYLEFYYNQNSSSLRHQPRKIPVVLHNRSVYSNGHVAWAPKRMELVTIPSADQHSQDHFEQLVLHEFRHVVQVDKLDQGLSRAFKFTLGEQGQGAVAGLMPFWFLEGNAVEAETHLSHSGRGRQPEFEKDIKAILLEKDKIYSYEKSYYGSFRDYVPSHYEYGYQMVAYGRQQYGDDLWSKMIDYTAKNPFTLYPFYFGLKKYTGLSKSKLYHETVNLLRDHWAEQSSLRQLSTFRRINRRPLKSYTSYRFPDYVSDSLIFAEKSGINQIEEFVLIDREGKEKVIHVPGFYHPANISLSQELVVWAEQISDERWSRESYSLIKSFDLATGQEKLLTRATRYFTPELSSDAEKIVAVDISCLNEYALVILDARTGKLLHHIQSPGNEYLQYPVWSDNGNNIFVTSMTPDGKKIKVYNIQENKWETLFHAGFENIAELSSAHNCLLFRGTYSGIDNVYVLDLKTNSCYMVTSSKFGAYYPQLSANGDKLIYSDYTSQGFDIVEMDFNESLWVPVDSVVNHREQLFRPVAGEEGQIVEAQSQSVANYPEKSYRKITNLFNIHSWAPFYFDYENPDIENPEISPGISLLSQNILSTAFTTLSYEYNLEQKDHFIHTSFIYKGFFPVFRIRYDFGGLPFIAEPPDDSLRLGTVKTNMFWTLQIYVPLDFTSNKFVRGINPSVESRITGSYLWYDNPGKYHKGLTFLDYRLYAYNYLKKSARDILPKWGQIIDLRYVHAPWSSGNVGSELAVQGTFYLPGLIRHNTLKIRGSYMKQRTEKYILNNLVGISRGYHPYRSEEFIKLTADYVFPVIYPDLNIWHFLYIKRIKASIFYDHSKGHNVYIPSDNGTIKEDRLFRSCGIELTSDFHFIHILFPFDAGIRYNYLIDETQSRAELILSIDISSF